MAELSEGDDVLSGVADLPLVELVLERLHDGRSVTHRVNQNDTKTSARKCKSSLITKLRRFT